MRVIFYLVITFIVTAAQARQAKFLDMSKSAGVNHYGANYGVAVGDFDRDGDEDVYISKTDDEANLLYENLGGFNFKEIGAAAGVNYDGTSYTAAWADIDNDGYLDLYLGNKNEPNVLYYNNGDGTFTDISGTANVRDNGGALSVSIGDLDNDGWVDIYIANINSQNVLYRNNGDKTFTNIIESSGATDTDIAMGAMLFDFDNDNDLDIYLSHDAKQPNKLYENDGSGFFTEIGNQSKADYAGFGMGTEFADFNNDGYFDIYISNLYENTLLLNNQDGTFSDESVSSGTDDYGMGWGVTCLDYDNDGKQDIYVANNSYFSPHPNMLYKNMGDTTFEDMSSSTSLESMYAGYGVASADFNNDGKVDLFLANSGPNGGNQIFKNDEDNNNNWVAIKTEGTLSNRSGIGTRVVVKTKEMTLTDQVASGTGYASHSILILNFGLGSTTVIEEITFYWPSGTIDTYENISVNQLLTVTESQAEITGIEEFHKEKSAIFPNPVKHSFSITHPDKIEKVTAYTLDGHTVITFRRSEAGAYNVPEGLKNGYYILNIKSSTSTIRKSFILNR